ncbi:MAG: winged helix-turn-helix domain-containing protein [Candidatus Pacebacteria bacterium]|nr:winged helix-turn-helix domain-containing protein [Candidatus Paceibacterota bacterium]
MSQKLEYKKLERIIKGFANHRRLQILELLYNEPELSVQEISEKLKSEFKNISAHISKMAIAGLLVKRSDSKSIRHKLTKRGIIILKFVRILE